MPAKRSAKKRSSASDVSISPEAFPEAGASIAINPWSTEELERCLRTGSRAEELTALLGTESYQGLRALAAQAAAVDERLGAAAGGRERVLILPGILGSELGKKRFLGLTDTVWIDLASIALGQLADLALPDSGKYFQTGLGLMGITYLRLKLKLRARGFDADFWPYDWRQGLPDLGRSLAAHLVQKEAAGVVHLVTHSMGGLVARAAMAANAAARGKVGRLIMLGTPNHGSFAVYEVLRATNGVVRKAAEADPFHSAEELVTKAFRTFPSVYHMLPAESVFPLGMYDPAWWPADGPQPRADLLKAAPGVQAALHPPDARSMIIVAGVRRPTVVSVNANGPEHDVVLSDAGDGTVPLVSVQMPGVPTWFTNAEHSKLPSDERVSDAVGDLLATGVTSQLWASPDEVPMLRSAAGFVGDMATDPETREGRLRSLIEGLLDLSPRPEALASGMHQARSAFGAAAPEAAVPGPDGGGAMLKVAIDPGHGMSNRHNGVYDSGAVARPVSGTVEEADVALRYALTLREKVRGAGWAAYMTREDAADSAPLADRAPDAKAAGCDVFLSLHLNDVEPSAGTGKGVEVWFRDDADRLLAQNIQDALVRVTGFANRGVKKGNLAVLSFNGPAVLIELGFIRNDAERSALLRPGVRDQVCEAIVGAVRATLVVTGGRPASRAAAGSWSGAGPALGIAFHREEPAGRAFGAVAGTAAAVRGYALPAYVSGQPLLDGLTLAGAVAHPVADGYDGIVPGSLHTFQDGAVLYESKFGIDGDGSGGPNDDDPTFRPDTSLHDASDRALHSRDVPFIVLPLPPQRDTVPGLGRFGLRLGDLGVIFYKNGRHAFVLYADQGPWYRLGEGSMAAADELGINSSPSRGGFEAREIRPFTSQPGVLHIVFPGTHDQPGRRITRRSVAEMRAAARVRFNAFMANR